MGIHSPRPAEISVEPPLLYRILEQSPETAPGPKRAVWVSHGMGQQKEFETLNQIAQGLRRAAENSGATIRQKARFVQIGSERLYRVELEIQSQGKNRQVDIYEAYWAPLTEGEVSLRDVVRFLWRAGVGGMMNFFLPPTQQRFGQQIPMPPTRQTFGHLLLALAILLSLMVMNASIVAVGTARGLFANPSAWFSEELFHNLSSIFNILLIFVIPLGCLLILISIRKTASAGDAVLGTHARRWIWIFLTMTAAAILILGAENLAALLAGRPEVSIPAVSRWFPAGDWGPDVQAAATALGLLSILFVGIGSWSHSASIGSRLIFGLLFATCLLGQVCGVVFIAAQIVPSISPYLHKVISTLLPARWTFLRWPLWVWPFLLLVAAEVRALLVQYVGDVAAYISPDRLDRFNDIRTKIKEQARRTAAAIYAARELNGSSFEYGQVAIVGHSLGSVIAYDTLNRLIKDDELAGNPGDIVGRTNLLLTFGSPLDKTAFVFALHGRETTETREALVAAVQPLIQDYRYRSFPWVNIWSPNDVISGRLDYYDAIPADPVRHIRNEPDPEATIPLVAHTEYWENRLVWEKLYQVLVGAGRNPGS